MRIISRKILREFWEKHPDSRQALQSWYADVEQARWKSPTDVKKTYASVSFLLNNRLVFNIKDNRYRLVIVAQYHYGFVCIRFVGTHAEYDRIDAETI
jgi:mRNA interferase HigB